MVLPLIPPAIVLVTTYTSTSLAVIGTGVGSASLTAAGSWWWWRQSNAAPLAEDHEALLKAQHQSTELRIADVDARQDERANIAKASQKETAGNLMKSVESAGLLDKSALVLARTTDEFVAAVTTAGAASQSLAQAMPSLEKVSSNIHDTSKKTIAELTRLSEHLDAAVAEKKPLLDTIEKQASEIKTLSQENQGLKTALTRAHSCLLFFANQGEAPGAQNGGPTTSHNDTPALR